MYLTRDKITDNEFTTRTMNLPDGEITTKWINSPMKLPHDESTDDEFTARWNYHKLKLPKMNLQHGKFKGDYITVR